MGIDRNISEKDGRILERENDRPTNHVYHAIHHDFTIKIPSAAHGFFQNHPQKHEQYRVFWPTAISNIFS
jgi:hypothetical protein